MPERPSSDRVVAIQAGINLQESTASDLVEGLRERWGSPVVNQEPLFRAHLNSNPFTTEVSRKYTVWIDEECDVSASVIESHRHLDSSLAAGPLQNIDLIYLRLDRVSFQQEEKETRKRKAMESIE